MIDAAASAEMTARKRAMDEAYATTLEIDAAWRRDFAAKLTAAGHADSYDYAYNIKHAESAEAEAAAIRASLA